MACPEALRLFDVYQEALISFHAARLRLPDAGDYETCFEKLSRARAAYWKHVEEHGCRTPVVVHGPRRILIVDDERAIRKMLTTAFSKAGYHVRTAAHASEAMNLLGVESADALLSDVVLNSVSGHDLVRWVSMHHPTVKCVLMTGFDEKGCENCPFVAGCQQLTKPFQPKDAVAAIEFAISRSGI